MKNPLVSIIIPVYNGSNFLKRAIDSALAQTYQNIEVIVINDGSKDDGKTEAVALEYKDKIQYFYKENGGVSSALNYGISKMKGEYFSWLSHDDEYEKDKVEVQIEQILKNKNNNLICLCGVQQINSSSEIIKNGILKYNLTNNKINSWDKALAEMMISGNYNGCALLIPKKAFEKSGLFDESLRFSQDVLMWMMFFFNKYSLFYYDKNLVYSRIHNNQVTQTRQDLYYKDNYYITKLILPKLIKSSNKKYNFIYLYCKKNAIHGDRASVKLCINEGKKNSLLTMHQIIMIRCYSFYGKLRPLIKKTYYKFFKNVTIK